MALPAASLLPCFLLLLFLPLSVSHASFELQRNSFSGDYGLRTWRRMVSEASSSANLSVDNSSYILAAERTYRRDPLNSYHSYTGGWNLSNEHYWASVGFTAAPLFAIALAWLVGFGLALFVMCCCYCCCRHRNYSYSRMAYAVSLILLILFTIAAIVGCVVLYSGQGKFHSSTITTMDYVTGQANITVDSLRNFSDSLAAAKNISVDHISLPADVRSEIDAVGRKANSSADDLASRTSDNSKKIKNVLDKVRLALIIVAAVMLALAFLGFALSILGLQFLVSILVLVGWILVAGTFILCGIFLLLHNVVADTCVAMDEWVSHPHARTALDDILSCVDASTANDSLYQSRAVTFQLVNLINNVIVNVSNRNVPPNVTALYYNQSGPLMPVLCNPYTSDLANRTCIPGEVELSNASQVWKRYECRSKIVSGSEICTTTGRVTQTLYNQMTSAVNVSRGLHQYGPFLTQLEDCTFVRQTFIVVSSDNCPGLDQYSKWIYVGLAMVSAAVMLSLVFWVIYSRERRHRKYNKQFIARSGQAPYPLQEKAP